MVDFMEKRLNVEFLTVFMDLLLGEVMACVW